MLGFALTFWKPIAIVALIGVVFFGVRHAKSEYDLRQQEIGAAPYKIAIEHSKQEARELLAKETARTKAVETDRDERIAAIIKGFQDAKLKDDANFNRRLANAGRLRDVEARCGGSGSSPAGTETKTAGGVEATGGGVEFSATFDRLLKDLIRDTKATIRQYEFCQAYAVEVSAN